MIKQKVEIQAHIKTDDGIRMYSKTYKIANDEAHILTLPIDPYGKSYVRVQLQPIKTPPTTKRR